MVASQSMASGNCLKSDLPGWPLLLCHPCFKRLDKFGSCELSKVRDDAREILIDDGKRRDEGMRDQPRLRNGGIERAHRIKQPSRGIVGLRFGGISLGNEPEKSVRKRW